MKLKRVFFLINAFWELARFILLLAALVLAFYPLVFTNRQAVYWLLIFGSPQLLLAAGLLVLYTQPDAQPALLNLMRLGKVLAVFSSLLLLVLEPLGARPGLRGAPFSFLAGPTLILLGVVFVDLIFLFLLLSYSPRRNDGEDRGNSLPDFRESRIPDDSES